MFPMIDLPEEYMEAKQILRSVCNRLRELREKAESGNLTFITTADKDGRKAYRRSTALLMQKAVHNLYGEEMITVRIMHSIAQGYYCELKRNEEKNGASEQAEWVAVDEQMLRDLKQEMQRLEQLLMAHHHLHFRIRIILMPLLLLTSQEKRSFLGSLLLLANFQFSFKHRIPVPYL